MSKLPRVRIKRASAHHKRAFVRWLREWQIDKLLRDDGPGYSAAGRASPGTPGRSSSPLYDVKPAEVGQIRLFHPFSDKTAERPRYVAVLKEKGHGNWLVAPFSRFSEPAVPGEWKTGMKAPVLRALCIWNARSLPGSVLVRSWVVDRMSASRTAQAVTIHGLLASGGKLPPPIARRAGPPLVHPLDPRVEYLAEEREWSSQLSAKLPSGKQIVSPYAPSESRDRTLPLAAEERGKYRSTEVRSRKRPGSR